LRDTVGTSIVAAKPYTVLAVVSMTSFATLRSLLSSPLGPCRIKIISNSVQFTASAPCSWSNIVAVEKERRILGKSLLQELLVATIVRENKRNLRKNKEERKKRKEAVHRLPFWIHLCLYHSITRVIFI